jgi:hypothetical protein
MALTQAQKTAKVVTEMISVKARFASLVAQADERIAEYTAMIAVYQAEKDNAAIVLAEMEKAYPTPVEKEP